jgi:four helix bundle protein
MSQGRSYRDLTAWQKSMLLVREVYLCTRQFPVNENYGLISQLRRSAVSVPSNIAEGQGRLSSGEFKQFLGHARGSLMELETQILIARDLNYMNQEQATTLLQHTAETGRVLNGLLSSLPSYKKLTTPESTS